MYLITEVPVDCTVHLCVMAAVSRKALALLTVSPVYSLCSTRDLQTEAISVDAARDVEQTIVGSIISAFSVGPYRFLLFGLYFVIPKHYCADGWKLRKYLHTMWNDLAGLLATVRMAALALPSHLALCTVYIFNSVLIQAP